MFSKHVLVIDVMGNIFNILKELSYENVLWKFTFAKSSPTTHTQLLQKHAVNIYHIHTMTYNNIMYSTLTMLDIVL